MRLVFLVGAPALVVAAYFASACDTGQVAIPSAPSPVSVGPDGDAALSDSSTRVDGSIPDGGSDDASPDAGDAATLCPAAFAGCGSDAAPPFDDQTAPDAGRIVTFRSMPYEYTPKCLRMKAGQKVTFTGDFYVHPLVTACGPSTTILDNRTDAGISSATFTMTTPGTYGYYCLDHGNPLGAAMSGTIDVVP